MRFCIGHDGHVDLAPQELLVDLGVAAGCSSDDDLELRVCLPKGGEEGGEEDLAQSGVGQYARGPGDLLRLHPLKAFVHEAHGSPDGGEKLLSLNIENEAAPGPLEEWGSDGVFEQAHGARQGRRGDAELLRGSGKVLGFGNHAKGGKPAPQGVEASYPFHDVILI
jgi:hypothetical protein